MIFWTHLYDLIAKLGAIASVLFAAFSVKDRFASNGFIYAFCLGLCIGLPLWWFLLRPLSSLLYAKLSLKTGLSFSEAKRASALFSPVLNMTSWHPMKEVTSLPVSDRPAAIARAIDELYARQSESLKEWNAKPWWRKAREIVLALAAAALLIAALEWLRS